MNMTSILYNKETKMRELNDAVKKINENFKVESKTVDINIFKNIPNEAKFAVLLPIKKEDKYTYTLIYSIMDEYLNDIGHVSVKYLSDDNKKISEIFVSEYYTFY